MTDSAGSVLTGLTAKTLFDLKGVVAVVTGGSSGIGLMISSTLMANGAKVYLVGLEQAQLDSVAKTYNDGALEGMGQMIGVQGDVSKKSEAARVASLIAEREPGGVTVLFNNAGVQGGIFRRPSFADFSNKAETGAVAGAYVKALFDDLPEESFNKVYNVNAVGPYWFTIAFLPLLEKWKHSAEANPAAKKFAPQVIMTSSMNGWTKDAATSGFSYPYMFSKSAVGHAVASLAHELLPLDIRVNGIAPGVFPTEMAAPGSTNNLGIGKIEDFNKAIEIPVNRFCGSRHDMGTLALFLVANWYVNGETVLIDGGTLLKHPSSY